MSDYKVLPKAMQDPHLFESLKKQGREEISIAEQEMPGLMSLRKEYGKATAFKGS